MGKQHQEFPTQSSDADGSTAKRASRLIGHETNRYGVTLVATLIWLLNLSPALSHQRARPPAEETTIWHDTPAGDHEGQLIGNGRIGGRVMGGPESFQIALNHEWLWRHKKLKGLSNPKVAHHLPAIRKLFFEGKTVEASRAANKLLGSQRSDRYAFIPPSVGRGEHSYGPDPYQPVGDLSIAFPGHSEFTDYCRQLDLSTAIAGDSYRCRGVTYKREVFASCTDNLLVIRVCADQPGKITCKVRVSRISDAECKIMPWGKDQRIGFSGEFIEGKRFAVTAATSVKRGEGRVVWDTFSGWPEFSITGADEAVILLSMTTDNEAKDTKALCAEQLVRITDTDFVRMVHSHVSEHQRLFGKAVLSLAGPDMSRIPTDIRQGRNRYGTHDPGLAALNFHYGRYILMSCSRRGGLPANLNGIRERSLRSTWNCDFHHDINFQFYYWPAEVANLAECAEAAFDYLDRLVPAAQTAARNLYGCRGIFIPLTTGPWAECIKVEPGWDEWTGAAAWLAQHYWWHYEFNGDKKFLLTRAYPFMKQVALFYEDYLIPDPRPDSPFYGKLVTVPSQSPENHFVGGIKPVSLCVGATSDFVFIYDVLTHCIQASEILGVDADKQKTWRSILDNIPPLRIGKHGQLQEWLEDYEEGDPGHRHVTHLMGFFPGDMITLEKTPKLAEAVRTTLERRIKFGGGGILTPAAGIYARLHEGDLAERALVNVMDLMGSIEGPPSLAAMIAEMLIQSHTGHIKLLPALPSNWPTGSVKGLCTRGGFVLDISWENADLKEIKIHSRNGGPCILQYKDKAAKIQTKKSGNYAVKGSELR